MSLGEHCFDNNLIFQMMPIFEDQFESQWESINQGNIFMELISEQNPTPSWPLSSKCHHWSQVVLQWPFSGCLKDCHQFGVLQNCFGPIVTKKSGLVIILFYSSPFLAAWNTDKFVVRTFVSHCHYVQGCHIFSHPSMMPN